MRETCGRKFGKAIGSGLSLGCALLAITWTGCGSGVATQPVSGTVVFEGQPVNGGVVSFAPIQAASDAKPAVGEVQPDGKFVLGTNAKGDGAVAGRHRVVYAPPTVESAPLQEGKHAEALPRSPYEGLMPKEAEVEVKAGGNEIQIELVRDPAAAPPPK